MHIYNITFIVEKDIEKSWIEHIDMVLLPEISNNVMGWIYFKLDDFDLKVFEFSKQEWR